MCKFLQEKVDIADESFVLLNGGIKSKKKEIMDKFGR